MKENLLEEIGMTKGEVAVYYALLELGSSSVSPIIKESCVSSSKVYFILERLIQKGLCSYVTKGRAKFFEAAPPKRILDYLREKKERLEQKERDIQNILPELELKQKMQELKSGAQIFKGNKGWKTASDDILDTLSKGEELLVTGIYDFDEEFQGIINRFHAKRDRLGIKARIMLNADAKSMGTALERLRRTEVKYLPKNVQTPGVLLIYANKTLITLPNQRTFFQIENEEAAGVFRAHFENTWSKDTETWKGDDAIAAMVDDVVASKEDLYLIGAHGYMPDRYPKEYDRLLSGIKRNNRKRYFLAKEHTRGTSFCEGENLDIRFLPEQFVSPMVIWIYGDTVAHALWENKLTIFRIKNKKVAEDYHTYFDFLKSISKLS